MENKAITILGAGNLGLSIANGLAKKGILENNTLTITRRNITHLPKLSEKIKVSSDNIESLKKADVIIICVQPHQFSDLVSTIKQALHKDQLIISTVTGLSLATLNARFPGHHILRAMPNTAIAVGESMTCIAGNGAEQQHLEQAQFIFNQLGHTLIVEEGLMQAATVVCASGIAFWMRFIRANCQGAIQLGFEAEQAQEVVMQTCKGAVELLAANGTHPEQEIDKVTTPAGCTVKGLNQMEFHGLSSAIIKGMETSFDQITKMSKQQ